MCFCTLSTGSGEDICPSQTWPMCGGKGHGKCCPHMVASSRGQGQDMGPDNAQVHGPKALGTAAFSGGAGQEAMSPSGELTSADHCCQHSSSPTRGTPVPDRRVEWTQPRPPSPREGKRLKAAMILEFIPSPENCCIPGAR